MVPLRTSAFRVSAGNARLRCLHGLLVELDRLLNELLATVLGLIDEIGRDLLVMELGAQRLVVPHHRLHAYEVDDAPTVLHDRELNDTIGSAPGGRGPSLPTGTSRADLVHLLTKIMRRRRIRWPGATLGPPSHPGRRQSSTVPSSTRKDRSTSMVKSTWPGVSMMLTRLSFQRPWSRAR